MRPVVDDRKCGAGETKCTAIPACPAGAISYTVVEEPILDRDVHCNLPSENSDGCGCGCDCGDDCGGTPYGRIIIDYDLCTECGVCADECCSSAIDMVD